tara:strand:- start:5111 stop:5326 length:216 start_codon:yes stop_codon:yes gene_type:complete
MVSRYEKSVNVEEHVLTGRTLMMRQRKDETTKTGTTMKEDTTINDRMDENLIEYDDAYEFDIDNDCVIEYE